MRRQSREGGLGRSPWTAISYYEARRWPLRVMVSRREIASRKSGAYRKAAGSRQWCGDGPGICELPLRFQHRAVDYVLHDRARGYLRLSVEGDGGVVQSPAS